MRAILPDITSRAELLAVPDIDISMTTFINCRPGRKIPRALLVVERRVTWPVRYTVVMSLY